MRSSRSCARRTSAARTSRACTPATSRSTARAASRCGASTSSASPWDVTPGVPAFAAAAAALRRELTLPGVAQTVILTRHSRASTPLPAGEELAGLAAHGTTLVLHLAVQGDRRDRRDARRRTTAPTAPRSSSRARAGPTRSCSRARSTTIAGSRARRRRRADRRGRWSGARSRRAGFGESHLYSAARERRRAVRVDACSCSGARPRRASSRRLSPPRACPSSRRSRVASRGRDCPRARCASAASAGPDGARALARRARASLRSSTPRIRSRERISELGGRRPARAPGVPLLRLERPGWSERADDDWHWVDDTAEAAAARSPGSGGASS